MTRCATCANEAIRVIEIEIAGAPYEEMAVCSDCLERLERQYGCPSGPLAPHSILVGLLAEPDGPGFQCKACGHDIENLARTGKLGCVECYHSFADEVLNLVRRSLGGKSHRGKLPPPRRSGGEPQEGADRTWDSGPT